MLSSVCYIDERVRRGEDRLHTETLCIFNRQDGDDDYDNGCDVEDDGRGGGGGGRGEPLCGTAEVEGLAASAVVRNEMPGALAYRPQA